MKAATVVRIVLVPALVLGTWAAALAGPRQLLAPPLLAPANGTLRCTVLNASAKKPVEDLSVGFKRAGGATTGTGCPTSLGTNDACVETSAAGFCSSLPCACIVSYRKGDRKSVRALMMSVTSGGVVEHVVELSP